MRSTSRSDGLLFGDKYDFDLNTETGREAFQILAKIYPYQNRRIDLPMSNILEEGSFCQEVLYEHGMVRYDRKT